MDHDWRREAACRNDEAQVFYPPAGGETRGERITRERAAKRVCASCTVVNACLNVAIATNEQYGVWGGLTDAERRRLSYQRSA